ncbi:CPBP family glutamic-type intramembrane protease [uncultured Polaribacter sp.]|uniref:CPBP family glutamic-type intramembrane protease n=1 Tax=uncultured Polaribacter sp. TaxID=174711 RepID=UPI00262DF75B|nr:CPBP family glutamic-type intramembrane protease [uncultured Polaribacter sp.]
MNFIQQAFSGKTDWYHWVLTILLVFTGWQILGVLPLLIAAIMHSASISEFTEAALTNFMSLGIDKNLFLFLMILSFAIGLFFLFLGIKYIHKRTFLSIVTSRKSIDWKRFWFGFLSWGLLLLVLSIIGILIAPEDYTYNFNPVPFFILLAISFLFLPLQTSLEELLFRGYFMQGLGIATINKKFPFYFVFTIVSVSIFVFRDFFELDSFILFIIISFISVLQFFLLKDSFFDSKFNLLLTNFFSSKLTPLIVTSVCFGLLHGANPEVQKLGSITMVFYIGTGLFYGITTLMDEGTEIALGLHAANNILAAFLITTDWMVFQTDALFIDTSEPSVSWEMFLPVFVLYPLMLILFSKKYKWSNWLEKLTGKIEKPVILKENYRILEDIGE